MEKLTKQIGVVAVDSGKLMICDPLYLKDWKHNKFDNIKQYKDSQSGKIYTYKADFNNYSDILFDNKSVKELIKENRLSEIEAEIDKKDFSFSTLTKAINQETMVQFNFPKGHAGLAFGLATETGDGEYPVWAEFEQEKLKKIWIEFD